MDGPDAEYGRLTDESDTDESDSDVLGLMDESDTETQVAKERLDALNLWLKAEMPLDYPVHTQLVRAVSQDSNLLRTGLPGSEARRQNIRWFATKVLEQVNRQVGRTRKAQDVVDAPFITKGGLAVMRAAVEKARCFPELKVNEDGKEEMIRLIVKAADLRKIMNIPWTHDFALGHVGRVVYDSWVNLGKPEQPGRSLGPSSAPPSKRRDEDALHSTQRMTETDCRASWSTEDLKVEDLYRILDRTCLPDEWNLKQVTLPNNDEYVTNTYRWVTRFYDGAKPIHKTAMLLSIIFSRCLPNIFHARNTPHSACGADEITRRVRNEAWIPKANKNRKGFSERIPFVIMMTTFIIALYEDESPLRKHMASNGEAFGADWTKKHGVSVLFCCR